MPWLSCYLNPLTLTCLGHEMAASCLTFLLCSNVTVSSYSFMVIADKKAPAHTLHTIGFKASLSAATSSVWHGLAVEVNFFCLLTVMGTNLKHFLLERWGIVFWNLEGFGFILIRFLMSVFYDDTYHNFLFPTPLRLTFQAFIFMVSLTITFQHFQLL